MISRAAYLVLSLVTVPTAANCAEISMAKSRGGEQSFIVLEGEIQTGDEKTFRKLALENPNISAVILSSPGGAVGPALDIGRAISVSGFATAVIGESYCTSACALIWLAGSVRGLSKNAKLGFHASYRDENGVALESGAANALVGQYLTQLGLPSKAILFATLAPPNDFLWLNVATAEKSGIPFQQLGSSETEREDTPLPKAAPPPLRPRSDFEEGLTKFPKDWVERKAAKNGFDVTPDGRIWINSDPYGDTIDYGVLADDLWTAEGRFRKAWIRGYHKRDPSVSYRESLQLIHIDCLEGRWGSEMVIHYDAAGKTVHTDSGPWTWDPIVPRSFAETWRAMICSD